MEDKQEIAPEIKSRLDASKRFFDMVAQFANHYNNYANNGVENEKDVVKALFDSLWIYIKKCQLAMMRQGQQITTKFDIVERIKLNQQEAKTLEQLYMFYLKMEAENNEKNN